MFFLRIFKDLRTKIIKFAGEYAFPRRASIL